MEENKRFGFLLKKIREEKGIFQQFIARKAGISNTYLSGIESGDKTPTIQTICAVAAALDLTFNQLLILYLKVYGNDELNEYILNQ
jgi:transcriptional regulator with XRE-family HTH domain